MKALPKDPFAFHARALDALIDDICDRSGGTPRLDALRAVAKASSFGEPLDELKRTGTGEWL